MSMGSVHAASAATPGSQLWATRYNPGDGFAQALAVSPDGAVVFVTGSSRASTGDYDYATVAYDAATGAKLWTRRHDAGYIALDLGVSPDGSAVFVTGWDYVTVAYDAATGATLWTRRFHPGEIAEALAVSPDGSAVFVTGVGIDPTTDLDYATVAYDAATGAKLWSSRYDGPAEYEDFADALDVSPDGSTVYVTGRSAERNSVYDDYATVAFDAETGAMLWARRYDGGANVNPNDRANAIGVSPDGSAVFVTGTSRGRGSSTDYATVAYAATTGAQLWIKRYDGPGNRKESAAALGVSPDGSAVVVTGGSQGSDGDDDYATIAYDAATGARLWAKRYDGHGENDLAEALGVSSDGSIVFVTGRSRAGDADYATVAYAAATGAELWAAGYDGPGMGDDLARDLGVGPDGSAVFVTGASLGTTSDDDYATVAYAA
jgi:WD40 repeat protein